MIDLGAHDKLAFSSLFRGTRIAGLWLEAVGELHTALVVSTGLESRDQNRSGLQERLCMTAPEFERGSPKRKNGKKKADSLWSLFNISS